MTEHIEDIFKERVAIFPLRVFVGMGCIYRSEIAQGVDVRLRFGSRAPIVGP